MARLFGTDGVRGVANRELSPELALCLGRAGALVLARNIGAPILVGRDTRISGDMLEAALVAGITSAGVDALLVGVVPTPAVAFLTNHMKAAAGVMISASHNPVIDNGIKFFAAGGLKLSEDVEDEITDRLNSVDELPIGENVGRTRWGHEAWKEYAAFLLSLGPRLQGMRIVVDAAHGAAYHIAPYVLSHLGAEVIPMHVKPNGTNINVQCGSTHPASLQKAVLELQAQVGLAFDGDADRLMAVDEKGRLVDGDRLLVIFSIDMLHRGELKRNTVAATSYSNLGLHRALAKHGGHVLTVNAGDRYVLEAMLRERLNLGGEQSGHIIFADHSTTGDGLVTALRLLTVMQRSGQPLSVLADQMESVPQYLVNVSVRSKEWRDNEAIRQAVAEAEEQLAGQGRLLVRASGTEPVIRVMAEGFDPDRVGRLVNAVADTIQRELGQ
ncbi:MAG: phosphoglucosamine mutase [Limnochordia bacterium]|jgi:phosphoglucosamine mutase